MSAEADEVEDRGVTGSNRALVEARAYSLLIVPVRFALALAGLAGALLLADSTAITAGLFGLGFGLTFFALQISRRRRQFWLNVATAEPIEAGARVESTLRTVVRATYPGTIAVTLLTAIALAEEPSAAAFLAGVLAGMALAALQHTGDVMAWEHWHAARLLIGRRRLYVR